MAKIGRPGHMVIGYTDSGSFQVEFDSIKEAGIMIGMNVYGINRSLRNLQQSCGKWHEEDIHWSYI